MVINCRYKKVFTGATFVTASGEIFQHCWGLPHIYLICSLQNSDFKCDGKKF